MAIGFDNPLTSPSPSLNQKYRFRLVVITLITILTTILGIGIILSNHAFDAADFYRLSPGSTEVRHPQESRSVTDTSYHRHQLSLATIAQAEKKEYREFFLKICQMILLNLLLPILTATLGYDLGKGRSD